MTSITFSVLILLLICCNSYMVAWTLQKGVRSRSHALLMTATSKYLTTNKPVFVAGGSNGVGLELVKKLSIMGIPVRALVRREEAVHQLSQLPNVKAFLGNALDQDAVQRCMEGCVAAVTTLGGPAAINGQEGERVDYAGNSNVVEQAGILGVERIVLVTSVGCGNTKDAISAAVYQALEAALVAKNKAERDLKMYTNLDWTIIRPGGLLNEAETGKAILTADPLASGLISRPDVADLIIKVLGSNGKCTRKELTAVDPTLSKNQYNYSPFVY